MVLNEGFAVDSPSFSECEVSSGKRRFPVVNVEAVGNVIVLRRLVIQPRNSVPEILVLRHKGIVSSKFNGSGIYR